MPRWFRLSVPKKNEERSASPVCLAQGDLVVGMAFHEDEELKVSIPISFLWQTEAPTLARLQARLNSLSALPHGWMDISPVLSQLLMLAKVVVVDGVAQVKYSIEVTEEFCWTLCITGDRIHPSSGILPALPQLLTSVAKVKEVIDGLASLPTDLVWDREVTTVEELQGRIKALSALPHGWVDTSPVPIVLLLLTKVVVFDGVPRVKFSIEVKGELDWSVLIGGSSLSSQCDVLSALPSCLCSVTNVRKVIDGLESLHYCTGNEDQKYFSVQAARKGVFKDSTGVNVAAKYVQDYFSFHTVRCTSCQLLVSVPLSRCDPCTEYRKILNAMVSRQSNTCEDSTQPESHTNYRFLNTPDRKVRVQRLRLKSRMSEQREKRIRERLERIVEERGVEVDRELHADMCATVEESTAQVMADYPPGSFQRIFWDQQQRAMKLKDSRSMRWEPAMIRWCLYLRHLSSSAYEVLRDTGVLRLPSQRTLRDYTYYTESAPGFSRSVDQQVMDTVGIQSCAERDKNVIIILDEMHIRENIVYDKHTGGIIGFTDLGEINNHLAAFEKSLEDDSDTNHHPLAKSMLVLMVRGLFSKVQFPYVQFPCSKLHGYDLYDIFWEAVERLERCGLNVLACTCDGLSVNRRFFKLHGTTEFVYKVVNPYAEDGRQLFFFSDPPHLVKTVRNSWSSNKRLMWYDDKHIEWAHLLSLYKKCHSNMITPGLTIVPKLKYEHLYLTSFSKMRVDLASQVLSNSVGEALKTMKCPEVEKTIEFVLYFDKFFDCLNVSSLEAGKQSRKPFKLPYHSGNDFRIKWLKEEFLGYLDKWEESVRQREGFTNEERSKMLLSLPTRLGLRLTVHAFVELVEYIFKNIPGVTVFLSNRICQDPLENFFGRQRQRGRVNENPSVAEFLKNTQALRIVNSTCATVRGNCRGPKARKGPLQLDNTSLKKRKTKH